MNPLSLRSEEIRHEIQSLIHSHPELLNRSLSAREAITPLGLYGLALPPAYGGVQYGALRRAIAIEELTRLRSDLGATLSAATLGAGLFHHACSEAQQAYWLPRLARGEDIATICMTEAISGSHLLGMQTRATPENGGWLLNGRKRFIGNSHVATVHAVIARTNEATSGRALSSFIVEASRDGCRPGQLHDISGLSGFSYGEVIFENCWIPAENLVGIPGDGIQNAQIVVERDGRPNIGCVALGVQAATLDRLVRYSAGRQIYGARLSDLSTVQNRIADVYRSLHLCRLAMYEAADCRDQGPFDPMGFLVAKVTASESAAMNSIAAAQAMGAMGCDREVGITHQLLDALMTLSPSGTGDVNRRRIAERIVNGYLEEQSVLPREAHLTVAEGAR